MGQAPPKRKMAITKRCSDDFIALWRTPEKPQSMTGFAKPASPDRAIQAHSSEKGKRITPLWGAFSHFPSSAEAHGQAESRAAAAT
jgi:hypothetical protein